MLTEFLLKPVEALLNRGLRQSASAAEIAKELEGRTLGLHIEGAPFDLRISIAGRRFRVTQPGPAVPDATISGTPRGLGRLLGEDPQAAIRDGAVRISGDAEIAEAFRDLLHFTRPDLEKELARLAGDEFAHEIGDAARAFKTWGERAAERMTQNAGEYFTREGRMLVTRGELEGFSRQVDELVNDVARAAARLQHLRQDRGRDFSPDPPASNPPPRGRG